MNTQAMNHDPHSPVFIRGKASPDKQTKGQVSPSHFVDWRRIIELALLLTLIETIARHFKGVQDFNHFVCR
mgnify:CR=1 FL=1